MAKAKWRRIGAVCYFGSDWSSFLVGNLEKHVSFRSGTLPHVVEEGKLQRNQKLGI